MRPPGCLCGLDLASAHDTCSSFVPLGLCLHERRRDCAISLSSLLFLTSLPSPTTLRNLSEPIALPVNRRCGRPVRSESGLAEAVRRHSDSSGSGAVLPCASIVKFSKEGCV